MRRALSAAAVGILLVASGGAFFAYHAALWLKRADLPVRSDVIVVLAGPWSRSMYAADLYRTGYAPQVALSEAVPEPAWQQLEALGIRVPRAAEIHRQVLRAKGVPEEDIQMLGRPALSTADEAEQIAARFGREGMKILVVTSPSHVMRARMIIRKAIDGRGASLAVCATPYEEFPNAWWTSQDAAREVLLEWAKIAWYLLGGRFRAAHGS